MIDKIYTVYGEKIVSVKVEKETDFFLFVDRPRELYYATQVIKKHACLTPHEAIRAEINIANSQVAVHKSNLEKASGRLRKAKELEAEYCL